MSGILAVINTDRSPILGQMIKRLTARLEYKGRHGSDSWTEEYVGLGYTLQQKSAQTTLPGHPEGIDPLVKIVCSARLDARRELAASINLPNHYDLDTTPDSELIIKAYIKWGERCVDYLLGDFAIIIWDKRRNTIFCARDRFGMRQLYVAQVGSTFVLCNSIQCLLHYPGMPQGLSDQALGAFLLFGDYTWLDKQQTAFKNIKCIPPAHTFVIEDQKQRLEKYWEIPADVQTIRYRNKNDYVECFLETFRQAVADRIRGKNMVVSLSGGLDSSAIAATMRAIYTSQGSQKKLHAVSIVYDKSDLCNERFFIQKTSDKLRIDVDYIPADGYRLLDPKRMYTTRPLEVLTPLLYKDAKLNIAQKGSAVITGSAGDNLLCYLSLLSAIRETNPLDAAKATIELHRLYGALPSFGSGLLRFFRELNPFSTHQSLMSSYPDYLSTSLEEKYSLMSRWKEFHHSNLSPLANRHDLLHKSLIHPDWNTDDIFIDLGMTATETCDPFLDIRLITTVLSIPATPWFFNKHILREAMRGHLPFEVLSRPKTPLGALHHTLVANSPKALDDLVPLSDQISDFVNIGKLKKLLYGRQPESISHMEMRPYLLQAWIESINQW
jgi:asparagine synthase (glutamine-hydrolysing)